MSSKAAPRHALKPESLVILENRLVTEGHYLLRLASRKIARLACPGQFVQILAGESFDPFLARPFSFLETGREDFSILYQVVGQGTRLLSLKKRGGSLSVLGPLGVGWRLPARMPRTWAFVGGGVGIPPVFHWVKELIRQKKARASQMEVFLGGRNSRLLHCEKDFRRLGVSLHLATDDGSRGQKGFVTGLLEEFLTAKKDNTVPLYACGPTPMLRAVSLIAKNHRLACQVSVEEPMPCGFGVCLGCAVRVREQDSADSSTTTERFALACTEGPVFDASKLVWSQDR